MPKGQYKRKKEIVKEVIKKQSPIVSPMLPDVIRRIFNNEHTAEDILFVGEKIKEFKGSELYILLTACVEYVINSELDNDKKVGTNNDERLGIQVGARRVLSTILGLDKQAIIVNKQMDMQRQKEEAEKEDAVNEDPENMNPGRSKVSI